MNPTVDKFIAVVAILCLIFFMSIILVYVERWNLALVTVVGLAMAAYDFWRELFQRRNGD
jgi:hypothetical protein